MTFDGNKANYSGGGIYMDISGPTNINNCHFDNNTAQVNGGAIFLNQD
jgi:predicted outer membrane repeat protein